MQLDRCSIPARSRRQVMEWGLVLASQGIEAILHQSEEGWELIVPARDYERAQVNLRKYQIENRNWRWQQPLPVAGVVFHWGSAAWAAAIAAIYYWSTARFPAAKEAGILDSVKVAAGQWWRLFTAVSLHENMPHLMANMTTGFILLGLAMARYGAGVGLLAAFLAGVAGNVAGLVLYAQPHQGLGASGMVMGALGLISAQSFAFWRTYRSGSKVFIRALAAGTLILVLIGFSPESDVVAHVGGFVSGALFGCVLGHARAETLQRGAASLAGIATLAALLVATWHLALRAP
ncbi:MAG: rhomboid family intramembrane serine protease [Verrucomicrobiota bacterium]